MSFAQIRPSLPQQIHFIHSEDLLQKYPTFTPKEREDAIAKEYGAVFIIGIGCQLSNGQKHDGRAPDYDDWSTVAENGQVGLNGDLLVWDDVLNRSLELSSMGIRVDKEALLRQLKTCNAEEKKELYFHKRLLSGELPQSIGGGIGQSRLRGKKKDTGEYDSDGYLVSKIPWSLSFNYSMQLRYGDFDPNRLEYKYKLTHALSFNGNIQPTKNWSFNFNATYDVENKKISFMTCNITRNLHCFQMSASIVPVGAYKSYTFSVAVSSSLLKDLKYNQSSSVRSGQDWY